MTIRAGLVVFIVLAVLIPRLSYGEDLNGLQPPSPYGVFSTLSAESPNKGQAAAELSYETILNSSFYRSGANFAYGLTDRIELSFSASDQRVGFEDVSFGLKHRFMEKGSQGPSMAYLLMASPSTGSNRLTTGGSYGGGFIMSQRVGPVYAHFNIFYAIPGDSKYKGEFRASGGLVFATAHNKWLLGEIYGGSTHYSTEIDQFEARLGYRMLLAENLYADLGMGINFMQDPADYRVMVSFSFLYPKAEKKIRRIYEGK